MPAPAARALTLSLVTALAVVGCATSIDDQSSTRGTSRWQSTGLKSQPLQSEAIEVPEG